MNDQLSCKSEGDFLDIYHLESESSTAMQSPVSRRSILSRLTLQGTYLFVVSLSIVLALAAKFVFLDFVYLEEWIAGVVAFAATHLGIHLMLREGFAWRWIGRLISLASVGLVVLLIASSFRTNLATGMAIRWMDASGANVTQHRKDDQSMGSFLGAFLGERMSGYFLSASMLDTQLPNRVIPERVLLDLLNHPATFELPNTSGSVAAGEGTVSPAINGVAKLVEQQGAGPQIRIASLNKLSDADLVFLATTNLPIKELHVHGPLSAGVVSYLSSDTAGTTLYGEQLSSSDILSLSQHRNFTVADTTNEALQFRNLYLVDCEINEESAPEISSLSSSITLMNSMSRLARSKWPLDTQGINLLIANKVPVMQMECKLLWGKQHPDLAELKTLRRIQVDSLDGAAVDSLVNTGLAMIHVEFLPTDAVEAMVRNQVTWAVNAERTDANIDLALQLVRLPTIKYFYLRDRSNYSAEERVLLDR
jgi:hypothetical protein